VRFLAITQRVALVPAYGERRDCLDQAWHRFIFECGFLPLPLPNVAQIARAMVTGCDVAGIVFSGGNDLVALGGDAPERDATELALLQLAQERSLPLLGVCRGMQLIQHRFGIELEPVQGHVTANQQILVDGALRQVNSYHRFGARTTRAPLISCATAPDGVIKAIRHESLPLCAIMWHPERCSPFARADVELFRTFFGER